MIVQRPPVGYVCSRCGDTWNRTSKKAMLSNGPCAGDLPWDIPESMLKRWVLPAGGNKGIVYNGKIVHPSHKLIYYRGLLYCCICGYYTTGTRIHHLARACRMKAPSSQKRLLRCMRAGRAPCPKGVWPLPDDEQCPSGLIPFQIMGEYADLQSFLFKRGRGPTGSMLW